MAITSVVDEIDFVSAERILRLARKAYETGDDAKFIACRKLLLVSLGVEDAVVPLKKKR